MKLRSLHIVLLLLSGVLYTGCGQSSSKPLSQNNRVVEFLLSDFQALNPYNSADANATYADEQIFQRLIGIDPHTMKYTVPYLATAMPTISADNLQFDFDLRKDIKWADGQPLTGADVLFSLKALKNPFNVLSAQKRVYVDAIHSAELIDGDPYRIRFKLWKPYFLILQAGFGDVLYILPKHIFDPKGLTDQYSWADIAEIVESAGNKEIDSVMLSKHRNASMSEFAEWFAKAELSRDPKYIQGSGPYKLDEWKTQQFARLVRNTNYVNHWGTLGEAFPDTLIYKTVLNFSSAVTALKSRDIDLLGSIQPQYWISIDTNHTGIARTAFPLGAFSFIGFNQHNPIFRDPGVRWAMAYMVDRKTIIDKLLYGLAKLTESPITSIRPEYNRDLPLIPFDPAKAQHILDSLDWKDHDGDGIRDKIIDGKRVPFQFTFIVNAGNETRMKVLLIYTEALRKIGIKSEVSALEWSVFSNRLRDHLFDAHIGSWINDPFEGDNYQLYHSSQARNRGSNYDNYSDPRADKLMEQIRGEFNETQRAAYQKELQHVFYEDQADLFLWEPLNTSAWVDRFDSVSWNAYRPGYNVGGWRVRGAGGGVKASME